MPRRKIAKLERLQIFEQPTSWDTFFIRPGSRSRPWTWFSYDDMPPFQREAGLFELELMKGGGWRVVRRVEAP